MEKGCYSENRSAILENSHCSYNCNLNKVIVRKREICEFRMTTAQHTQCTLQHIYAISVLYYYNWHGFPQTTRKWCFVELLRNLCWRSFWLLPSPQKYNSQDSFRREKVHWRWRNQTGLCTRLHCSAAWKLLPRQTTRWQGLGRFQAFTNMKHFSQVYELSTLFKWIRGWQGQTGL